MTTYPSRVKRFTQWSKAMVEGATVGNPDYSRTTKNRLSKPKRAKRKRKRRKRKKMKDA